MNDKILTDSEYIAGIAEHYKGKGIAEFEQHHARLTAIAARLTCGQKKTVNASDLLDAECSECGGRKGYMAPAGDDGVWHNCDTCRDGERLNTVSRYQAIQAIAAALAQQG